MAPPAFRSLAALVLLALVAGAAANPVAPPVFRRSCADCSAGDFWCAAAPPCRPALSTLTDHVFHMTSSEFAYPGAPADRVACIAHNSARSLYRRYDVPFTFCSSGGLSCSSAGGGGLVMGVATSDACIAKCTGTCIGVNYRAALQACFTFATCSSWSTSPDWATYVTPPATCAA
ncbi:hypothetical protein DFJ74DRAFT_640653 [Hyaloraphidium curvatum]|nr:hypothetical protein DFJ74DRAFT_640653 [Hyaloraphidium curvatum]